MYEPRSCVKCFKLEKKFGKFLPIPIIPTVIQIKTFPVIISG